ncbi:hypothetical protein IU459_29445 [Nocardia amamiensis]|uniref:Lipoprotein n=1 Tax=Nocardia amamiensis TaxID=404578 RepID=A0ABS0D3E9_9NOCA|nr:hypothetical protein [Nocardia amamiensis]MBF6301633.1 hypothetical protein [Nocardia amamiensis]
MIGPVVKTDAAVARAGASMFGALPLQVRVVLLALGVLVAMAGCSAAWIDQQSYVPSPNICRADEVTRTDCVHVNRVPVQPVPTPAGWQR